MNQPSKRVVIAGGFDDPRSRQFRLLEEGATLGQLTVLLWSDEVLAGLNGRAPKFTQDERRYLLEASRFVSEVRLISAVPPADSLPNLEGLSPDVWVVDPNDDRPAKRAYSDSRGIEYKPVPDTVLKQFPAVPKSIRDPKAGRKKVLATGCYDWFHSGHVRFFEEVSAYGDLYVVIGHDANIRLLKGEGHPMFPETERRYLVQSVRHVTQALISTGTGWLDAEPEIERLKPDIYAVNEDGDRGGKREFCERHGIEYLVLKRTPKAGLPKRTSTTLRGF